MLSEIHYSIEDIPKAKREVPLSFGEVVKAVMVIGGAVLGVLFIVGVFIVKWLGG